MHHPYTLPEGLPAPEDDGACDHLAGMRVPAIALPATTGGRIDLAAAAAGTLVLYLYPRTGRPGVDQPPGWDEIPGARGCTSQSCAFRDHQAKFAELRARVLGVSAQTTEEQREFAARTGLPFPLLSDARLALARALRLPTFAVGSHRYYKRVTLVAGAGTIDKVFYPVFPPDRNADEVVAWLERRGW